MGNLSNLQRQKAFWVNLGQLGRATVLKIRKHADNTSFCCLRSQPESKKQQFFGSLLTYKNIYLTYA